MAGGAATLQPPDGGSDGARVSPRELNVFEETAPMTQSTGDLHALLRRGLAGTRPSR